LMLRFHTQTAGSSLMAQQPEVNVVRTTIQALAAVLGGTQSLHTNSMDEALALPTESTARLALRTQQVIAYESGVVETADPLGGSYAIEHLTDEIEAGASEYLKKIEAMGGMLRAIETGYVQREIQEAAYRYQKAVEAQEQVVVGVNKFQLETEPPVNVLRIDPELEQAQVERLRALRDRRNTHAVMAALNKLKQAATTDENLLPRILECVESYATVGEISNALRDIWGEYRETSTI
jgi:methylmalonyl-CoA mutase N-terminal domain/subunit